MISVSRFLNEDIDYFEANDVRLIVSLPPNRDERRAAPYAPPKSGTEGC